MWWRRCCSPVFGSTAVEGFTKKYGVKLPVWFELFGNMQDAIKREKQLKEWQRGWKIELIEKLNPLWADLYDEQCGRFIP